jgi:signal transduction histidine kinase
LSLNDKLDDFLAARLGLTFYYFITAVIILGGSSIITYNAILSNFTQSISENIFLSPNVAQAIIDKAQDILFNRFLTIDSIIILITVVIAFLLTSKTLKPIKISMEKQKRFIADASHELRTPTAVVISGLEVALSNKKLDFGTAKKTLENTLDEMREFSKLSNTLLDISKYDMSARVKHEPVNIDKLLEYVVEKNKSLTKLKEINIETKIESGAIVKGDKIELARVFYNIFDNAIKYTSQNGMITVLGKINSNKYIITISDNGVGIPNDILSKIFEPFFRGEEARHTNGAGLGLTLSKKIIENHHGVIAIKSVVNKGTSVIISLPITS